MIYNNDLNQISQLHEKNIIIIIIIIIMFTG